MDASVAQHASRSHYLFIYSDGVVWGCCNLGTGDDDAALLHSTVNSPLDKLHRMHVQRTRDSFLDVVDLVLLEEKLDAIGETFHVVIPSPCP